MEVLDNAMVNNFAYINVSNQQVMYLKLRQYYISMISHWRKKWPLEKKENVVDIYDICTYLSAFVLD